MSGLSYAICFCKNAAVTYVFKWVNYFNKFGLKCVLIELVVSSLKVEANLGWSILRSMVIYKHAVTHLWTQTIVGPWPNIPQIVAEQEMDLTIFGQQLRYV